MGTKENKTIIQEKLLRVYKFSSVLGITIQCFSRPSMPENYLEFLLKSRL